MNVDSRMLSRLYYSIYSMMKQTLINFDSLPSVSVGSQALYRIRSNTFGGRRTNKQCVWAGVVPERYLSPSTAYVHTLYWAEPLVYNNRSRKKVRKGVHGVAR